ncbi:hypothetical protein GCM10028895_01900 [Pontibacter rugosus]
MAGQKVLIGEATGVSQQQSYELYQQVEEQMKEAGVQPYYVVEQEMDLRMNGLQPGASTDTSNLAVMERLGYAYYLKAAVNGIESGTGYNRISAAEQRELQAGYGREPEDNTKAIVNYTLYSTSTKQVVYTLAAKTTMTGISIPEKEIENGYRGSKTVNLATTPLAVQKAYKKGIKKILENCQQ